MRYCFIINPNSRSQRGRAIWEEVQKELEKKYPNNKIILTESIDKALLGGYIIKVNDIITDRSSLGMLIQLEKNLTGGVGCGC